MHARLPNASPPRRYDSASVVSMDTICRDKKWYIKPGCLILKWSRDDLFTIIPCQVLYLASSFFLIFVSSLMDPQRRLGAVFCSASVPSISQETMPHGMAANFAASHGCARLGMTCRDGEEKKRNRCRARSSGVDFLPLRSVDLPTMWCWRFLDGMGSASYKCGVRV